MTLVLSYLGDPFFQARFIFKVGLFPNRISYLNFIKRVKNDIAGEPERDGIGRQSFVTREKELVAVKVLPASFQFVTFLLNKAGIFQEALDEMELVIIPEI